MFDNLCNFVVITYTENYIYKKKKDRWNVSNIRTNMPKQIAYHDSTNKYNRIEAN